MPISSISPSVTLDTISLAELSPNAAKTASTAVAAANATSTSTSTSTSSNSSTSATGPDDLLTQNTVKLLKALAAGDLSGAQSDLAQLESTLKTQQKPTSASNRLTDNLSNLMKDLASGNVSSAKQDIGQLEKTLQSQDATFTTVSTTHPAFEKLLAKISTSITAGTVDGALQELATYLVQTGQGTGSLINTSA